MPLNPFLSTLPKLRRVLTRVGDTPQRVATRELGNAARWSQLVQINGLQPPYITDSPALRSATVLLAGQDSIQVPNNGGAVQASASTDPAVVYGVDMINTKAFLVDNGAGDFAIASGVKNFTQALRNRLDTSLGDLLFHPTYGNGARALRGGGNTPQLASLVNQLVQRCVAADDRVSSVRNFSTQLVGDALLVKGVAVALNGTPIDVTAGS